MSWAPELDYLGFDKLETFSISQGGGSPTSVPNSSRTPLSYRDIQFAGGAGVGLQPQDLTVILRQNDLGSVVPSGGDVLTDADGVKYVIQSWEFIEYINNFRCVVRRQLSN
jgi:hypothetical protein